MVNELVKHLGATRRRDFKREYGTYLQRSGLPKKAWPVLGGAEVDLSHLHEQVKRRGGYDAVGRNRQWMEMVRGMGVPLGMIKSAMSTQLRELYVKHVLVRPLETAPRTVSEAVCASPDPRWRDGCTGLNGPCGRSQLASAG